MERPTFALVVLALVAAFQTGGIAADRLDQKLSKDQRIIHALNRLTFGARPGDVEQVRRMGVEKWIDLQLHPERIRENEILAAKLQPLATLQMATRQIFETYQPGGNALGAGVKKLQVLRPNALLTPQQMQTIRRGTAEEKAALLNSLDPDKRLEALASLTPDAFADLPEFRRISMASRQPPAIREFRADGTEVIPRDLLESSARRSAGRLLVEPLQRI